MSKAKRFKGMDLLEPIPTVKVVFNFCDYAGKNMYSEKQANTQINNLKHARWNKSTGKMRKYKCPDCGWWHLTSRTSSEHDKHHFAA